MHSLDRSLVVTTKVNPIEAHRNWQMLIRDQSNWPDFHTPRTNTPVIFLRRRIGVVECPPRIVPSWHGR